VLELESHYGPREDVPVTGSGEGDIASGAGATQNDVFAYEQVVGEAYGGFSSRYRGLGEDRARRSGHERQQE
jgi:hypothetical protein